MLSSTLSNKKNLAIEKFTPAVFIAVVLILLSSCAPYQARRSTVNYHAIGDASWYGPGFAGRKTANGERYNPNALTAAHRTLPFGTTLKVTNIENGKSVMVRINDRGPFVRDRILDLSKGAAQRIGLISRGVAAVELNAMSGPTEKITKAKELLASNHPKNLSKPNPEHLDESAANDEFVDNDGVSSIISQESKKTVKSKNVEPQSEAVNNEAARDEDEF